MQSRDGNQDFLYTSVITILADYDPARLISRGGHLYSYDVVTLRVMELIREFDDQMELAAALRVLFMDNYKLREKTGSKLDRNLVFFDLAEDLLELRALGSLGKPI